MRLCCAATSVPFVEAALSTVPVVSPAAIADVIIFKKGRQSGRR